MATHIEEGSKERFVPPYLTKRDRPELGAILVAPKGEVDTYGATPLDRILTLAQQIQTRISLQELTYRDLPDDVPLEIIDYVHRTFAKRFDARGEANEENFTTALNYECYDQFLNEAELAMVERGRLGHASAAELLLIQDMLGMKSIELACLTHPHGTHIEILDEMRSAAQFAIELFDGEYYADPEPIFKVKESLNDTSKLPDLSKGVLMTRKRTMGRLPDGTIIKERSSFVLRTDPESGFDQAIVARLKDELGQDPTLDWMAWLVDEAGLDTLAKHLLDNDAFSLAIPISTTTYAFNKGIEALVAKQKELEGDERRKVLSMTTPELYEAVFNNQDLHRAELARIALEGERLTLAGIEHSGPKTAEELETFMYSLEPDSED